MNEFLSRFTKNLKTNFEGEKKIRLIVFLGLAGLALILLSSYLPRSGNRPSEANEEPVSLGLDAEIDAYVKSVEERLRDILAQISGVGKTEVMVSVSCTKEYVYAEDGKTVSNSGNGGNSSQTESKLIIIDKKGEKEALLKKINTPQISGVVIVCEGGDSSAVKEHVYRAASVALELPMNKIHVAKLQKGT